MIYQCKTPVLLIIFNRTNTISSLIDVLRMVKPSLIFVAADGPRAANLADEIGCRDAQRVIENVDWVCEIKVKKSSINLGVGRNPAEGITWALNQVEELIILEDDCIPNVHFFQFCDELLEMYREHSDVTMISGNNHSLGKYNIDSSYTFSYHTQTHGWATWRRSWHGYDIHMRDWAEREHKLKWIKNITGDYVSAYFWKRVFDQVLEYSHPPYWDYQWTYCCWKKGGFNIIPAQNLVSNIGYGEAGTNTLNEFHPFANLATDKIFFPLKHPSDISYNIGFDRVLTQTVYDFTYKSIFLGLIGRIRRFLKI